MAEPLSQGARVLDLYSDAKSYNLGWEPLVL